MTDLRRRVMKYVFALAGILLAFAGLVNHWLWIAAALCLLCSMK